MIEIYGKSCSHCGVYFESKHDSKVYCSSKCSEKAYDKRHREKTNPLISVVCCICGKTAQRSTVTRGGQSPKTCGNSNCVKSHKVNLKKAWIKNNKSKMQEYARVHRAIERLKPKDIKPKDIKPKRTWMTKTES
jgi:hypothetical protein